MFMFGEAPDPSVLAKEAELAKDAYFRKWFNEEAKDHIVGLYAATGHEHYVLLAHNLYYAIESYIFFGDHDKIHVRDIVVFLERVVKSQLS
jgi:hypothetical protein